MESSGTTVFHLEPNLKETPGGLRDCNVASWLALISAMGKLGDWPDASSLRAPVRKQLDARSGISDGGAVLSAFSPRA